MSKFLIYRKTIKDDQIEVFKQLPIDQEFVKTHYQFDFIEDAKKWIQDGTTYYVVKEE